VRGKAGAVKRVVATPHIVSGQPRIKGTRITVKVLWALRDRGHNDGAILEMYPALTLDDLKAAWEWK